MMAKALLLGALAHIGQWVDLDRIDQKQTLCLAETIYFEARGEPVEGQLLVAETVLNRVNTARYPSTICGVVHQSKKRGVPQFSWTLRKSRDVGDPDAFYLAVEIAVLMQAGFINRQHPGVTNFYNPEAASPVWANDMTLVKEVGDHVFLASAN